jgi:hypothetical protein
MTWNPHDPTQAGGYADWKSHGERYGNWGQFSGSTMVPDKPYSYGTATSSWNTSSYSSQSSYTSPATAAGGGSAILFLVALWFAVRFRDEIILGAGVLAATAILYKIASVYFERKIFPVLTACIGVGITCFIEYRLINSEIPPGAISGQLFSLLGEMINHPVVSNHMDLLSIALIGVATGFVAFFSSTSTRQLIFLPLSILVITLGIIGSVSAYQAFSNKEKISARVSPNTQPSSRREEETVFINQASSSLAAAIPTDSQRPTYVTVNTESDSLRLRSCPITCPVVARLPKGSTVKVVSAGKDGWPEIETTHSDGSIFRGFADGRWLK